MLMNVIEFVTLIISLTALGIDVYALKKTRK